MGTSKPSVVDTKVSQSAGSKASLADVGLMVPSHDGGFQIFGSWKPVVEFGPMARRMAIVLALASSAEAFAPVFMCERSSSALQGDKAASSSRRDLLKAGALTGFTTVAAEITTASSRAAAPILRSAPAAANQFKNSAPVFSFVEKGGKMGIEAAEELIAVSEGHGEKVLQEILGKL
jgi:hypothetical protein